MNTNEQQQAIARLINEGEKDEAVSLLLAWSRQTSFKHVIFNILEPMLVEWGRLWMQGKLSLAHGYISGKVAEEIFLHASRDKEFLVSTAKPKGTIVIGNIEDDFHPLGRRLVTIFAKTAGWNIIDLGNDVTAEIFIASALEHKADIIAVSAMMFTTAKNIAKIRTLMEKQSLSGKIQLAVGGAVFKLRPELVSEMGADGTAGNAIEAPELFDSLLIQSSSHKINTT
ncbi:MAG: B12-binding domain-containing protein [Methanosarcina sp.]